MLEFPKRRFTNFLVTLNTTCSKSVSVGVTSQFRQEEGVMRPLISHTVMMLNAGLGAFKRLGRCEALLVRLPLAPHSLSTFSRVTGRFFQNVQAFKLAPGARNPSYSRPCQIRPISWSSLLFPGVRVDPSPENHQRLQIKPS